MKWATEEFATVQLGDKRLNSRVVKVAEQLAAKLTSDLPGLAQANRPPRSPVQFTRRTCHPEPRPGCCAAENVTGASIGLTRTVGVIKL